MKLADENLACLPKGILVPAYERSRLSPGIVHIGLGNFHRAHQAWYLHRLMQQGLAHDWAIIGAGVRQTDEEQRKRLSGQNYLSTLIELDPVGRSAEVTGSMIGFVPVETDNAALIQQMADPAIRIVALTVTEGGYYIDPVSKEFDRNHEDIRHDCTHPDSPRTAFGAIVAALRKRRDAGHGPFTVQSCDNLQGNGAIVRQTVTSLANMSDPDLANWIDESCTFPNSMVDCIVPATGPKELELVREFGIEDNAPVTHENFRQWVIEDDFCAGRPDWDKAGATFCSDVHAYEMMKIRILNGGHQLVANAGELLSVRFIAECLANPVIRAYFRKTCIEDIVPHVPDVPGMSSTAYLDLVDNRFSNPQIVDTVRRVAFDGSSRHTGFLLPTIRDAIKDDCSIEGLALSQAVWARMCYGRREDGSKIEPNDPMWEDLQNAASDAKSDPAAWLNQQNLYGDLGEEPRFAESFTRWLKLIWDKGTQSALQAYMCS